MPSRRFECKTGGHNKFWTISWSGSISLTNTCYTISWGKIGYAAQVITKNMSEYEYHKLVTEKIHKEYIEQNAHNINARAVDKPKLKAGKKSKEFEKKANSLLGRNMSLI